MRFWHALLLFVVGIATLAGGIALQPKAEKPPAEAGQPAFPGLAERLPTAATLEIVGRNSQVTLHRHDGDSWTVEEAEDYPANTARLRGVLSGLAELRLVARRTADPALFHRLGVNDPTENDAGGTQLHVMDAQGHSLATLVIGHRGERGRGGLAEQIYLRRGEEHFAWLAEGHLDISPDPLVWLKRDLFDIKAERIERVDISREGETLTLRRQAGKLALDRPPAGPLDDIKPVEVAQALEAMSFVDVRSGELPGEAVASARFTTADAHSVTVQLSRDGEHIWARFALSEGDASLGLLLGKYVFELPAWRLDSLAPKPAAFIKPDRRK